MAAGIYHWLYGDCHSRKETNSSAGYTVIRYFWCFVKARAYSVSDVVSDHRITPRLDIALDRRADIADSAACTRHLYAFIEAFSGRVYQPLCLCGNISTGKSGGIITVIALKERSKVNTDDVSAFEFTACRRYAMNHLIVNRYARGGGITCVTLEIRGCALTSYEVFGELIKLCCGNTRLYRLSYQFKGFSRNDACLLHNPEFTGSFKHNHFLKSQSSKYKSGCISNLFLSFDSF